MLRLVLVQLGGPSSLEDQSAGEKEANGYLRWFRIDT